MHSPLEALTPAIILLAAGVAVILASRPLKLSPIVGFLAGGIALGPHGFRLIQENETTALLAELGVVFLLFELGMQFTIKTLRDNRSVMLRLAPLQVLFCATGFGLLAYAFGIPAPVAIAIGGALSISSTAVLAQVLAERDQLTCPVGKTAISVSVFQDIAAIFVLIYGASLIAPAGGPMGVLSEVGQAAAKAAIGFALALTIGPTLLSPVFRALAQGRNQEAFTAVALLLALALAAAATLVGLTMTLGAFLAGLMIAATPYRHVIETEAKPFRGLLLSFFFFTVGMKVDLTALAPVWPAVLGVTAAIIAVKFVASWLAARASGWSTPGALQLGAVLSQGSEFAFVILALPAVSEALGPQASSVLIASIALTLALTPISAQVGMATGRRLARALTLKRPTPASPATATTPEMKPIIIVGLGDAGRRVSEALRSFDKPAIAIESDADRFSAAVADGYEALYGEASDMRFMETIGVHEARAIVLTAARYEISSEVTPIVRERYPHLTRYVAASSEADAVLHAGLGMRPILDNDPLPGLLLAKAVLRFAGVEEADVESWSTAEIERANAVADGMAGPIALPAA